MKQMKQIRGFVGLGRFVFVFVSFILVLLLFFIENVQASVIISEVELNPEGTDTGNEWLELYADNNVNINNWKIKSSNGREMYFNASFSGYFSVKTNTNLLTNDNNIISLYDGSNLIFSTMKLTDSLNNDKTWQYCQSLNKWVFENSTKNSENKCSSGYDDNDDDKNKDDEDENENQDESLNGDDKDKIYIELDWDKEEIINDQEFSIEVKAFNLDNKEYDIKVWIENKDEEIISERECESSWKSGLYFCNGFFSDKGDQKENIEIRMKKDYKDYSGKANVFARIRLGEGGGDKTIDDFEDDIEILNNDKSEEITNLDIRTRSENLIELDEDNSLEEENVIILGQKEGRRAKLTGSIIYKSRNEYIKDYAILALSFLCVLLLVIWLIRKIFKKSWKTQ